MKIQLVSPAEKYRETVLDGLREFRAAGASGYINVDVDAAERDFGVFVAAKLSASSHGTESVPRTHLWAIADERFAGQVSVRHALDDALRIEGGHIGYETVPSFRGRGVATEMLRQALPVAHGLGLAAVLLTCDEANAASIRVIEKNGGTPGETRALGPDGRIKRYYWITLSS